MAVDVYELGTAHDGYTDVLAMEIFHFAAEYFESSSEDSKFSSLSVPGNQRLNRRYEDCERLTKQWKEMILSITGEVREKPNAGHSNEISHVTTLQTLEYELFSSVQVDVGPQIFCNALRMKDNIGDCSEDSDHHVVALYNMGLVHHRNGKDDECMALLWKALSVLGIMLPSSLLDSLNDKIEFSILNPLVIAILNNIGQVVFFKGDHDDALKIFSHSLQVGKELIRKVISKSSKEENKLCDLYRCVAIVLSNVARIHFHVGEIHQAIQVSLEMVDMKRETFGCDHLGYAAALYNCGILHFKGEELEEALKYFRTFVQLSCKKFGYDRRWIVSAFNNIVLIEHEMGMHNNSLGSWHEILSEQIEDLGFDDPYVSQTINQIASLHLQNNDQEIALEFYQERLRVQRGVLSDTNDEIAQTLTNIGQTYQHLDLHQDAVQYYHMADTVIKSSSSD
eukprot:CAMPEP_0195541184 /NCGR_PEP_ID=MMETSP0794_2-20130614/50952_1 /TAXON_ID=515487 /ORGANISM="Stephanopyxis turris, Strain CCMP 815" /LENGTH=451 /DNA_ID=CAMNT_0040675269 /DNA_START=95 /DNA_END=1450 /DNA_ORIENTATION=+